MAEENDIIELWEKGKERSPKISIDIDKTIQSRSKGTLYWIRIILMIELVMNVLLIPILAYLYLFKSKDYTMGPILMAITLIYIFYYSFLIREINQFNYSVDVKTGLKKLYRYLNFFLLHYKVVIWLSLIIGLVVGFFEAAQSDEQDITWTVKVIFITALFGIVMISIIGLLFTFLINLIYGRKIKRLKKLVKEFE